MEIDNNVIFAKSQNVWSFNIGDSTAHTYHKSNIYFCKSNCLQQIGNLWVNSVQIILSALNYFLETVIFIDPTWQLVNMAWGMFVRILLVFETVVVVFSLTPQIALNMSRSEISSWSKLGSNGTKFACEFSLLSTGNISVVAF